MKSCQHRPLDLLDFPQALGFVTGLMNKPVEGRGLFQAENGVELLGHICHCHCSCCRIDNMFHTAYEIVNCCSYWMCQNKGSNTKIMTTIDMSIENMNIDCVCLFSTHNKRVGEKVR